MHQDVVTEKFSGTIERVTFHNSETGFCVLRVKNSKIRDLVTVVTNLITVTSGEYIDCTGSWHNHKTHGLQFKAIEAKLATPNTIEGIEKYLGSGLIKGIGPAYAKILVAAFGVEIFNILEHSPTQLLAIAGIGKKRYDGIMESWESQKAIRNIMMFFNSYGIGTNRAYRIYKTYGKDAINIIKNNPYQLAIDIHGIGFKTADLLAQKMGIPKDSILRAKAGVHYILRESNTKGHVAMLLPNLITSTTETLEIPESIIQQAIIEETASNNIIIDTINGEPAAYLSVLYNIEVGIAERLVKLLQHSSSLIINNFAEHIQEIQKISNINFSQSQIKAIELALQNKVTIITGGPGVGKTTVINSIIKIIKKFTDRILLCAPTGRAAKRLAECTNSSAKTLHRLLEFDPKAFTFKRNESNPLLADLVIVDESSMLDCHMMHNLMKALPKHAALILVGDIDQLPSVGAGAVLQDLINSEIIPTARLTEIFRQAATSKIITNAHRINKGKMPDLIIDTTKKHDFYFIAEKEPNAIQQTLIEVVMNRIPKKFNLDPIKDIQVLTPMNRGNLGARSLNLELQKVLNPNPSASITKYGFSFAMFDKVIQTSNNYDNEVFNGDLGFIESVDLGNNTININFEGRILSYDVNDLDEISLAYATSIHKSQGSEYKAVVVPLAMQHYTMLERNLIYTAITRAKSLVVLIGDPKALAIAVHTKKSLSRITNLKHRLRQAYAI